MLKGLKLYCNIIEEIIILKILPIKFFKIIKKLKINLENEDDLEIIKKKISIKQKIDILINSAAVASGSIFEMTPISNIKKTFQINFFLS